MSCHVFKLISALSDQSHTHNGPSCAQEFLLQKVVTIVSIVAHVFDYDPSSTRHRHATSRPVETAEAPPVAEPKTFSIFSGK